MATLEELQAQKKENSAKWHTAATQEEKDALHQENVNIMKQIDAMQGSTSTYDGQTGKWTTTGGGSVQSALDRSYAARLESALGELGRQKDKGLAEYNAQASKLPERYQAARNSAAAQNAIAKKNFDAQAAASGLNSGTSGQAALSRSAAYQAALSGLDRSQASDLAEIDRAKATLIAEYNANVAKAKADSDAALAEATYQEMIRQDNIRREDAQLAEEREWRAKQYQDALRADSAGLLAQGGIYSGYGDLYGWTPEQTQTMQNRYLQELQRTDRDTAMKEADWYAQYGDLSKARELGVVPQYQAKLLSGSSRSGSGGGTTKQADDTPKYLDSEATYLAMQESGDPYSFLQLNYKALGVPYNQVNNFYKQYQAWEDQEAKRSAFFDGLNKYSQNGTAGGSGFSGSVADGIYQALLNPSAGQAGIPRSEYIGIYNQADNLLRTGGENTALQFMENNWDRLSEKQREEIKTLFSMRGYDLSEG